MKHLHPFILLALLTACTFSVNNSCSVGRATDLIDSAQEAQGDVSPNLNIPVVP